MKIIYAILITCLSGYATYAQQNETPPEPINLTVWVHGSFVGPTFIMHDFFFRHIGIVKATAYAPRYHSRDMALSLCKADPTSYQMEHIYFWGWSGKLSSRVRKREAKKLYQDLLQLLHTYHTDYPHRPIRLKLISHSHGGNVLLNLSQVQDEDKPLLIDELILFSCPVQFATRDYVRSDCFKKIYSFYSADLYQVIDFQRTKKNGRNLKMHSERRFEEVPRLHQAKIKINGWALMHIEFMFDKFLKHVPRLCNEIDAYYASLNPKQQKREKLLHVQTANCQVNVRRKLF